MPSKTQGNNLCINLHYKYAEVHLVIFLTVHIYYIYFSYACYVDIFLKIKNKIVNRKLNRNELIWGKRTFSGVQKKENEA